MLMLVLNPNIQYIMAMNGAASMGAGSLTGYLMHPNLERRKQNLHMYL